jgi:IS30 family transposase
MGQYKEFIEIFKQDLEKEQEKLRIYQRGELRSMTLEAGQWCDSTVIAIEQTKQQITELKDRITRYKKLQA